MTATISLADLSDALDNFFSSRVLAAHISRASLEAADAELVVWFAERGVTLIVDRDTATHERLTKSDMVMEIAAERGIPVIEAKVTELPPESVAGLPSPNTFTDAEMGMAVRQYRKWGKSDEEITEMLHVDIADIQRWDAAVVQHGGINHTGIVRGTDYVDYTLEVTIGNQRHSFMMSQRYASEDMAKRDYTAAASIKRLALTRHTEDASEILRSWEPS